MSSPTAKWPYKIAQFLETRLNSMRNSQPHREQGHNLSLDTASKGSISDLELRQIVVWLGKLATTSKCIEFRPSDVTSNLSKSLLFSLNMSRFHVVFRISTCVSFLKSSKIIQIITKLCLDFIHYCLTFKRKVLIIRK